MHGAITVVLQNHPLIDLDDKLSVGTMIGQILTIHFKGQA